jgi:hypothetical protein
MEFGSMGSAADALQRQGNLLPVLEISLKLMSLQNGQSSTTLQISLIVGSASTEKFEINVHSM